jgi:hypothetical protein
MTVTSRALVLLDNGEAEILCEPINGRQDGRLIVDDEQRRFAAHCSHRGVGGLDGSDDELVRRRAFAGVRRITRPAAAQAG